MSGVTVSCFVLSYLLVAGLEGTRWMVRVPYRMAVQVGLMGLGWIAQTLYLADRLVWPGEADAGTLLRNWNHWALVVSWGLATLYLILLLRRPGQPTGTFLLPLILALLALAWLVQGMAPFEPTGSISLLRAIHGLALLVGMMLVAFGAAIGAMYLLQSAWLKRKRLTHTRCGSLAAADTPATASAADWPASAASVAVGLVSGLWMEGLAGLKAQPLRSSNLLVALLLIWLIGASFWQRSHVRRGIGRSTALVSIARLVVMLASLGVVMVSAHG
ncbi:MAG: hypothetical protein ACKN81_01315 [Pirellulaceae bacterium]